MRKKEIALIKETRQSQIVGKIMDAIAPYLSVRASDKVGIKINLSGSKEIYANTHYETVEALIFYLKEKFGVADITVVEGADGAYFSGKTTWDILYKFKYKEVELNGAQLANLDELPHEKTLQVQTISGTQEVAYAEFPCDYLISVVPPKTHNIMHVALSVSNLIGFVKPEHRVLMFGASANEMKKINFFQSERYFQLVQYANQNFVALLKRIQPQLAIIDGLYGMEGRGPIKGSPVFHGFAIASEDVVLTDSLTSYVMGFGSSDIPYLSHAFREGLGNNFWQNVVGVDPQTVKFPYRPHPLFQRYKKWRGNGGEGDDPDKDSRREEPRPRFSHDPNRSRSFSPFPKRDNPHFSGPPAEGRERPRDRQPGCPDGHGHSQGEAPCQHGNSASADAGGAPCGQCRGQERPHGRSNTPKYR